MPIIPILPGQPLHILRHQGGSESIFPVDHRLAAAAKNPVLRLVVAKHVHHANRRQADREQVWPLVDDGTDEQAAPEPNQGSPVQPGTYTYDNGPNTNWGGLPIGEGPGGNCTGAFNESGSQGYGDQLHYISGPGYYGGHPKIEFDFDSLAAPVLGQWAEDDDFANPNIARFEAELRKRDKVYEFHTYPGTKHAFFNDDRPEVYDRDAAVRSWERTIDHLTRYL